MKKGERDAVRLTAIFPGPVVAAGDEAMYVMVVVPPFGRVLNRECRKGVSISRTFGKEDKAGRLLRVAYELGE